MTSNFGVVSVRGLKDLSVKAGTLANVIAGRNAAGVAQQHLRTINESFGMAAQILRDRMRSNAAAQGWPRRLIRAIFKYNDPGAKGRWGSALAGVRTGAPPHRDNEIYREWKARYEFQPLTFSRRKGMKVKDLNPAGKLIGMSLARIYESGTQNPTAWTRKPLRARRAIAPAIYATANRMKEAIRLGYEKTMVAIAERAA